jgi:hypothetical protein
MRPGFGEEDGRAGPSPCRHSKCARSRAHAVNCDRRDRRVRCQVRAGPESQEVGCVAGARNAATRDPAGPSRDLASRGTTVAARFRYTQQRPSGSQAGPGLAIWRRPLYGWPAETTATLVVVALVEPNVTDAYAFGVSLTRADGLMLQVRMNDGPDIAPADLDPRIVARARACVAPVVVLPLREIDGIGIYPQGTLTLGKRLRAEGVGAVYLHDSEHRRFEVKKGFVLEAVEALLLGIGSSAGWDAIKALLARSKSRQLEVTYLELETPEGKGIAWKAVGEAGAVARAIDLIRTLGGGHAPANENAPRVADAAASAFEAAGSDEDLRLGHARDQIARRRQEAERLRAAAEHALADDPPDWATAEQQARQALHFYARSLDWAEDTAAEEEAHRLMDEGGAWVRSTFGC